MLIYLWMPLCLFFYSCQKFETSEKVLFCPECHEPIELKIDQEKDVFNNLQNVKITVKMDYSEEKKEND